MCIPVFSNQKGLFAEQNNINPDSLGERKEYLYHPREDLIKQFVGIRKMFNTYGEYGVATVSDMFSEEERSDALVMKANWMKTSVVENLGNGQFKIHALPTAAQFAPVYDTTTKDMNQDGQLDILLIGNDFGMEVQQGRADAFQGLVLQDKGNLQWQVLTMKESNFYVPGDAKALATLLVEDKEIVLATQNKGQLKVFELAEQNARYFLL